MILNIKLYFILVKIETSRGSIISFGVFVFIVGCCEPVGDADAFGELGVDLVHA